MQYSSEMNVKQNDQQREDMHVFPEVSVQSSVVCVGIDVDRREFAGLLQMFTTVCGCCSDIDQAV